MKFRELCAKEIVQLSNGACLGRADDLEMCIRDSSPCRESGVCFFAFIERSSFHFRKSDFKPERQGLSLIHILISSRKQPRSSCCRTLLMLRL